MVLPRNQNEFAIFTERSVNTAYRALPGVWKNAQFIPGAWVIVAYPGGRQLMNTLRPVGEPLPARTVMPWMERAFASKRPFVSDVYFGALAQRAVASV